MLWKIVSVAGGQRLPSTRDAVAGWSIVSSVILMPSGRSSRLRRRRQRSETQTVGRVHHPVLTAATTWAGEGHQKPADGRRPRAKHKNFRKTRPVKSCDDPTASSVVTSHPSHVLDGAGSGGPLVPDNPCPPSLFTSATRCKPRDKLCVSFE